MGAQFIYNWLDSQHEKFIPEMDAELKAYLQRKTSRVALQLKSQQGKHEQISGTSCVEHLPLQLLG